MTIFLPSDTHLNHAAEQLRNGELVAFPTETVYGLGANATDDLAVAKIFEAKNRPSFNPLISHFARLDDVLQHADLNIPSLKLAEAFWPGPLTLIVDRPKRSSISLLASAGQETIALRVPAHPIAQKLLQKCDFPVVAPSANPSGRISPSQASHVLTYLGDKIDVILEGGACECGIESTVIDCRDETQLRLLRPGPITTVQLSSILGQDIMISEQQAQNIISPGQLASHYAPAAQVRLNVTAPQREEAYLSFNTPASSQADHFCLSQSGDLTEAAANLFRFLHQADACGKDVIAVAPIPNEGIGVAINDRLRRAAAPRT